MNIRYSVCIHEAGHYQMAKFIGHQVESVEINIDKVTNETRGSIRPGDVRALTERKERGSYWRANGLFRCVPFHAGGLIAEYLHFGKDDFWKNYTEKNIIESQDLSSLKDPKIEENVAREEMEILLRTTSNLLSLPTIWKSVLHMAERLNTDINKNGAAGLYSIFMFSELEKRGTPQRPEYQAYDLIKYLLDRIYEK
jgi:hypothetical protein